MDFTLSVYGNLLDAFKNAGYTFITSGSVNRGQNEKVVLLRHDVDRRPGNALKTAVLEHDRGICGIYYFRAVRKEAEVEYVKAIAAMGHEIGYHYEDLSVHRGDYEKAINSFRENLSFFRRCYSVTSACMHGSPLSGFDNRLLWSRYDYHALGIMFEPYFDLDATVFLYLSDTGRRWDGSASIRDKAGIRTSGEAVLPWDQWAVAPGATSLIRTGRGAGGLHDQYRFKRTKDILKAVDSMALPQRLMLTVHPQRWDDNTALWLKELVMQNIKNSIKQILK